MTTSVAPENIVSIVFICSSLIALLILSLPDRARACSRFAQVRASSHANIHQSTLTLRPGLIVADTVIDSMKCPFTDDGRTERTVRTQASMFCFSLSGAKLILP